MAFLSSSFPSPLLRLASASPKCPNTSPRFLCRVESVRSRCQRLIGSSSARVRAIPRASLRFPSAFSKSIGFTLCGMVELPTSPAITFWPKYPSEM